MTIKASWRPALVFTAGLWICFGGPAQAANGDTAATGAKSQLVRDTKHAARHWKKDAHHNPSKPVSKSAADTRQAPTDVAASNGDKPVTRSPDMPQSSDIPHSIANANAQLASGDATVGIASAMSARATTIVQAAADNSVGTQIVPPDQLNEVDRALHESEPSDERPAATQIAMVSTDASAAPAAASSNDSSSLDRTSLIGKIFIGVGALLTMASAVRMFMA